MDRNSEAFKKQSLATMNMLLPDLRVWIDEQLANGIQPNQVLLAFRAVMVPVPAPVLLPGQITPSEAFGARGTEIARVSTALAARADGGFTPAVRRNGGLSPLDKIEADARRLAQPDARGILYPTNELASLLARLTSQVRQLSFDPPDETRPPFNVGETLLSRVDDAVAEDSPGE
jgi:hypothetical protein